MTALAAVVLLAVLAAAVLAAAVLLASVLLAAVLTATVLLALLAGVLHGLATVLACGVLACGVLGVRVLGAGVLGAGVLGARTAVAVASSAAGRTALVAVTLGRAGSDLRQELVKVGRDIGDRDVLRGRGLRDRALGNRSGDRECRGVQSRRAHAAGTTHGYGVIGDRCGLGGPLGDALGRQVLHELGGRLRARVVNRRGSGAIGVLAIGVLAERAPRAVGGSRGGKCIHEFSFAKLGGADDSALGGQGLELGELETAQIGGGARGARECIDISHC